MDTVMQLSAYGKNREKALQDSVQEIQRLDALLNAESSTSEVSRLNQSGYASLSDDTAFLVRESLSLYEKTDGIFDITIYPITQLWGFPSKNYRVPAKAELQECLDTVGSDQILFDSERKTITLGHGQSIDLGGIAKGYTSQRIMDIYKESGITSGLVSLGGNVQCLGRKPDGSPWKIGIQNPFNTSDVIAIIEASDCAVITSGGYQRFFEDTETGKTYRHIIDPRTGYPAEGGLASVSIIASDGTLGDGLSTALYIMGLEKAISFWRENSGEFDAVFITESGDIYATEGLRNVITSDQQITYVS